MTQVQIQYFLAVAHYMSITKAAASLYVSQPAISKQIRALETELGVQLFFRENRTLALTPAGIVIRDSLTRIRQIWANAESQLAQMNQKSPRPLRIGCLDGWDTRKLIKGALDAYRENLPDAEVEIATYGFDALAEHLSDGSLDLIITMKNELGQFDSFSNIEVATVPCVLVFSRHFKDLSEDCKPSDLSTVKFFYPKTRNPEAGKQFILHACKQKGFAPGELVAVPNLNSMISNVENDLGVILVGNNSHLCGRSDIITIPMDVSQVYCAAWRTEDENPLLHTFLSYWAK